jgi:Ca2+-binding EF-hand superfamily protein
MMNAHTFFGQAAHHRIDNNNYRHDDTYINTDANTEINIPLLMERTMKFSKIVFSMLTVLGASAAFNVFAQSTATPATSPAMMKAHEGRGFAALDKNGDGVISRDEAAARPRMAKMFDTLDTNKDGALAKDEMKAAHDKMQARQMARNDTDRDGRISRAEAAARPKLAENFDRIDTNSDGFVTKEEMMAVRKTRAAK